MQPMDTFISKPAYESVHREEVPNSMRRRTPEKHKVQKNAWKISQESKTIKKLFHDAIAHPSKN